MAQFADNGPVTLAMLASAQHKLEDLNNTKRPSMYGIFTYIWWICMVNVGKYMVVTA